jgi:hypothetical protein
MEIDVLCAVGRHPNLVAFYGACIDDKEHPIILEELMTGPNVDQFFQDYPFRRCAYVGVCMCMSV